MKMVLDDLERYFDRNKTIRVKVDESSSLREIFKERLLKDRVVPRDIGRNPKSIARVTEEEINKFREDFISWVKNSQHDRGLIIINE